MKKFLLALAAIGAMHLSVRADAADIANGKLLVERNNCAACHGLNMNHPITPEYPKLAGQHADYAYFAMRSYQVGSNNPLFGRNNPIMIAQMQGLSQRDLHDIAAYLQALPSDLTLQK